MSGSGTLSDQTVIDQTASGITIQVNGKAVELDGASTVATWLDGLGRDPRTVAIEYNGEILPRTQYGETSLVDGDRLEVVQFVQGG